MVKQGWVKTGESKSGVGSKVDLGWKCGDPNLATLKGDTDACSESRRGKRHDF